MKQNIRWNEAMRNENRFRGNVRMDGRDGGQSIIEVLVQLFLIAQHGESYHIYFSSITLYFPRPTSILYITRGNQIPPSIIPQNDYPYDHPFHRLWGSSSQGCWCPCHGGLLPSSCASYSVSFVVGRLMLYFCVVRLRVWPRGVRWCFKREIHNWTWSGIHGLARWPWRHQLIRSEWWIFLLLHNLVFSNTEKDTS